MNETTKVSIVSIKEYKNVEDAIVAALELIEIDFKFDIDSSQYILLKPNLLIDKKDACTQPSFVKGIIKYLKLKKISMEKVFIGDSPGQVRKTAITIAKKLNIYDICEKEGLRFINFEKDTPIKEEIKDGIKLKEIFVSKPVKECDIIINLPKLKTHGEATITGAIKNYWGIIPGGLKAKYHLLGRDPFEFGECLIDTFSWVVRKKSKRITIYDLDKVMQGPMGPVSGKMINWGLILAGTDELALDIVALEIGKVKAQNVPHIVSAIKRKMGIGNIENIEIVGKSLEEAKKIAPKFKIPGMRLNKFAAYFTSRIFYKIKKKIPVLQKDLCIKCGDCVEICPAKAIKIIESNFPQIDRKTCISCLCCSELCSQQAIKTKKRGFIGLFHSY
ncbi:MAG: DUF362 domain-containing protein [Candidatus Lokiarchaeota archaeon]|nr:DUF362 domain-containing protein [Candidatus Lokiarchaeota archaeon]